jgi:hypothetical protein
VLRFRALLTDGTREVRFEREYKTQQIIIYVSWSTEPKGLALLGEAEFLYSPSYLEEVFSETELPLLRASRKLKIAKQKKGGGFLL